MTIVVIDHHRLMSFHNGTTMMMKEILVDNIVQIRKFHVFEAAAVMLNDIYDKRVNTPT